MAKIANIEEELKKIEAVKEELLKQKETAEADMNTGESAPEQEQAKVLCAIQAVLVAGQSQPSVIIDGSLFVVDGLCDYIKEYVKMAMRQQIVDTLSKEGAKNENA